MTCTGVTLIEVIIYTTLLSLFLSGFIAYVYGVHSRDIELMQKIWES